MMAKLNINEIKKNAIKVNEIDFSYIDGKYLRNLRVSLKMSQVLFAEYLGVSKKAIEKWEQGKNPVNGTIQRMLFLIESDPAILSKLREVTVANEVIDFKKIDVFKYDDIVYTSVKEKAKDFTSFSQSSIWDIKSSKSGGNLNVSCNIWFFRI